MPRIFAISGFRPLPSLCLCIACPLSTLLRSCVCMPHYLFPCLSPRRSSVVILAGCDAVNRVRFVACFFVESRYAYSPWLAVVIMMPVMIIGFCCLPAWFIWFVFLTFVESADSYSHHSRGLPSVVLAAIVVLDLINSLLFLVCLFVTIVMLCFVDPALSVIAAASCRSGSSRWHSYGSRGTRDPAVAARPLPGVGAVRALRGSSWPSCALRG